MKFYAQQCKRCEQYSTCVLDNERPKLLVQWLHRWIANEFHGYNFPTNGYRGRNQNREPHRKNLCEACRVNWCAYRSHD